MNRGTLYAIGAYIIWGSFPVYFKQLHQVAALEVIGHRIVWSFVALAAVVVLSREAGALLRNIRSARAVGTYAVAAALIAINWLVFVWAVNNGHVVECSLGYFIAPLTSVLFGVALLRERMRTTELFSRRRVSRIRFTFRRRRDVSGCGLLRRSFCASRAHP